MFNRSDVLTVLCPAAAESPAYRTLEKKDKDRGGNDPLPHRWQSKLMLMTHGIFRDESLYSWIISSGHPIYITSTISPWAVVVNNLCIVHRGKQYSECKRKQALELRIRDKQARLGRSQPKQSVEFKIKLERKLEITYGQPKRRPLGAWWSIEAEHRKLGYGELKSLFWMMSTECLLQYILKWCLQDL